MVILIVMTITLTHHGHSHDPTIHGVIEQTGKYKNTQKGVINILMTVTCYTQVHLFMLPSWSRSDLQVDLCITLTSWMSYNV